MPGVDEYSLTVPSFTGNADTRITGWYLEPECTTAVDPSTITTDSTVYAKWETVTKHTVTFIAVSYTHLDVYKRQRIPCTMPFAVK